MCITLSPPAAPGRAYINGIYWKLGSMPKQTVNRGREGGAGRNNNSPSSHGSSTLPPPPDHTGHQMGSGRLAVWEERVPRLQSTILPASPMDATDHLSLCFLLLCFLRVMAELFIVSHISQLKSCEKKDPPIIQVGAWKVGRSRTGVLV